MTWTHAHTQTLPVMIIDSVHGSELCEVCDIIINIIIIIVVVFSEYICK